jgi:hypothetical protein
MMCPDGGVTIRHHIVDDILGYRRQADQLRTGVGAASLEQTHPSETHEGDTASETVVRSRQATGDDLETVLVQRWDMH